MMGEERWGRSLREVRIVSVGLHQRRRSVRLGCWAVASEFFHLRGFSHLATASLMRLQSNK